MILQITDNSLYLYGVIAIVVIIVIALFIKGDVFSKITKGGWIFSAKDKTENDVNLTNSSKNKVKQGTGKNKLKAKDSNENDIIQN